MDISNMLIMMMRKLMMINHSIVLGNQCTITLLEDIRILIIMTRTYSKTCILIVINRNTKINRHSILTNSHRLIIVNILVIVGIMNTISKLMSIRTPTNSNITTTII